MNREQHKDTDDDPFWQIINPAVRADVLVELAAKDKLVKEVTTFFILCFRPEDASEEQACRDALEGYVVMKYGILPELSERVFTLAEAIIREEELRHGEA